MTFSIEGGNFCLDDRKVFLNSGEIHYFRIKRALWDKHLTAAREAGLTTISTYVPWAWHEPEEGVFDFDGSSCAERDLEGWLKRCQAHGLFCILKPGPFILAEFRGAGLPDWFLEKHGEACRMRNSRGEAVASDGVNLFNSVFLEKVALWYDQVMPFISKHELSAGGPVIMMQICNEIGVFSWLARQADYGNNVKDRFIAWLANRHKTIAALNEAWLTAYTDFSAVELPPDGNLPYTSKSERGRDHEWHLFWRSYYGDYLRLLCGMARERGVRVPLYHNLPGWIYGHGYEFPVNITMYEDLFAEKSEIIFGVDHIPEFVSHRNMHDDRIINDITAAMQGNKPVFAAEFQCGSREYHVVPNPRELELFYKASIANGLTGWNYYMFSQGRNRRHTGYSGDTFYWFTPLTPEGDRTSAFPLVKRMSKLVSTSEKLIVDAHRKAEVCVLFYPPQYASELERPVNAACGLAFTPSAIRRPAYFDGLLKVLQVLNIDYDMADLSRTQAGSLSRYKQVWMFSTDEMNATDQQALVEYARAGGQLVLFPYLPDRELSQTPCTIIRDALELSPAGKETIDSPLIDLFDLKDIKCANPQFTFDEGHNMEVIARTIRGTACGFIKKLGNGSVIHLGTWIGFDTEGHKPAYAALLRKSGARLRQADSGNDCITVRERFTGNRSAMLFVGNYYNEAQRGKVTYTHPQHGEEITLPFSREELLWPALYATLSPVCLDISDGLSILHTTSDVLGISETGDHLEITLFGDRDLPGEIVFEGAGTGSIRSASVNGEAVTMHRRGHRVEFRYTHSHNEEIILSVTRDE